MSKQLTVHIIEYARTLIADENHWCRRQIALGFDGSALLATDVRALKYCAYGALIVAASHLVKDHDRAYQLASSAVSYFGGSSALIEVNDIEGHATVLTLFDQVLAANKGS
jgi:hypothetical protein